MVITMKKSGMQTSPTTRGLIIAAGQGTRLSAQADLKPLIRIRGVPLIQRVIEQGVNAGLCEFYVTVGYQHQRLEEFLVQLREQLGVAITTIHNPHWQLGNGSSVLAARAHLEPPFVLMMADHLIEPRLVRTLTAHSLARDQVMLAVDRDLDNSWVDLDDVTRVRTREVGSRQSVSNYQTSTAMTPGSSIAVPVCSTPCRSAPGRPAQPQ